MSDLYPLRLEPILVDKPWGVDDAGPYFGARKARLGEAWYTSAENRVLNGSPPERTLGELTAEYGARLTGAAAGGSPLPILAKLLFVSENLSVQVHPDDAYAKRVEGGRGKTEMWHVVAAEPGARVALGLTEPLSRERLIATAVSREIEDFLNWVPVAAGDTLFVPAGLVHTIGPGVTICEIQQQSDLTYRLYDFGRLGPDGEPRELHLEKAADVARTEMRHGSPAAVELPSSHVSGPGRMRRRLLASCDYFAAERLEWSGALQVATDRTRFELLVILAGSGRLADEPYEPGTAFLIPAEAAGFEIETDEPTTAVRAYPPERSRLDAEVEAAARAARSL